jgi:cytochrome b561
MLIRNTSTEYGFVSKFFHWGIALLFLIQYFLIFWKTYFLPPKSAIANFFIAGLHEPIGIITFIFAVLTISWRLMNVKPIFPLDMPSWERFSARSVHLLLYLVMLVMPLSGLLMTVAGGHPPSFFGLFQIPEFMAPNKALSGFLWGIHESTAYAIVVLVGVHILAALKHHFIDRDNVLKRML